jgi:hypothetical protein
MIAKLIDKVLNSLNAKLDVMKLSIIERISIILGFFMFAMVGMIMAVSVIIFLGIGLSEYFAAITGSIPLGYLIVSGIYILLLVLILVFKKQMNKWFAGLFISLLTSNEDDDEPNHPKQG